MTDAPQIFLSYVHKDEEIVKDLYQKLSKAGFKPWMDKKDIVPGEKWRDSISRAIKNSDFFLICLSLNSVNRRGFLQKEIRQALEICQELLDSDIYLIPGRLEDCTVPESLHEFQAVDLFRKEGWTRLLSAIQKGMEQRSSFEVSTDMERRSVKISEAKILIVDNASDIRSTLDGILSDEGFVVWSASNEAEALDAVNKETFDFAIIDVRLHKEDEADESGLSLALAIRHLNPNIRVIHLTGYVRSKQIVRAIRDYEVVDFVEKTPDMDREIIKILKRWAIPW